MVNSYRYAFAATTSTVPLSGTTVDLGIGEIGVFDGKTFQATDGVTAKSILIAQGVPDTVFPHGVAKSNHTYKTDVIKGSAVKSWKKVSAQKGQGMIVTLGYDGADASKSLKVKQGKSFTYWVTLSGPAIANLLGDSPKTHYAVWTEQFTVQLPCVSECTDNCGNYYDENVVADAVIAEFNKRKIIGGQYLTDYVKATKLVNCDTPSGLPAGTTYTTYGLTIVDAGDQAALGAVQAQYPGVTIKRVKREGLLSTYEAVSTSSLADFEYTPSPIFSTCDTCPSGCPEGYTEQPAQDIWVISRPLNGAENFAVPANRDTYAGVIGLAYGAIAAEFLSYNSAAASVKIAVAAGTPVVAKLSDFVTQVATDQAICTPSGSLTVTTEWVACKTCTTAKKNFSLTVANDCLNPSGTILAELQSIYGESVVVAPSGHNPDTCTTQFLLPVESSNKDCDACADVVWTFKTPAPFKGLVWTEVQGNVYGEGCVTGIKFESIYEQRKAKECFLKQVAYEFEPLFITLSTRNPDPNDYSVLCETDVPHTVIRNVSYPKGFGRVVADHVIASNFQYNQPWRKNPAERDAFEYELGIDLNGYYDQYVLEFQTFPAESSAISGFGVSHVQTFEASFFFPVGTGSDFETIVTAFVSSNSPLALEVI